MSIFWNKFFLQHKNENFSYDKINEEFFKLELTNYLLQNKDEIFLKLINSLVTKKQKLETKGTEIVKDYLKIRNDNPDLNDFESIKSKLIKYTFTEEKKLQELKQLELEQINKEKENEAKIKREQEENERLKRELEQKRIKEENERIKREQEENEIRKREEEEEKIKREQELEQEIIRKEQEEKIKREQELEQERIRKEQEQNEIRERELEQETIRKEQEQNEIRIKKEQNIQNIFNEAEPEEFNFEEEEFGGPQEFNFEQEEFVGPLFMLPTPTNVNYNFNYNELNNNYPELNKLLNNLQNASEKDIPEYNFDINLFLVNNEIQKNLHPEEQKIIQQEIEIKKILPPELIPSNFENDVNFWKNNDNSNKQFQFMNEKLNITFKKKKKY